MKVEMASFSNLIIISCQILHSAFSNSPFPASTYYWPMEATNRTFMLDKESFSSQADLYGVTFISVSRLKYAASLGGQSPQWIDVDAGLVKDCLAFQFSSCGNDQSISIAFWVRMRNGRRIIATGSFTNSSSGPGILIYFDTKTELLHVDFASSERHWSVNLLLRKYSWCHVSVVWTIENGLVVVLDGRYKDANSRADDTYGVAEIVSGKPYTKMITIGRPKDISNINSYGDFDIAHLVIYFRSLTDLEISTLPTIAISKGTEYDLICCAKKQNDPCYKDPCLRVECLDLEFRYTDCVCPDLFHPKCPVFPSTIAPTTSLSCETLFKQQEEPLLGCGNKISSDGQPMCGSFSCFYGICDFSSNGESCRCPELCDSIPNAPVCGSDNIIYSNVCTLKKAACRRHMNIVVLHKGFCESPLLNATHYWVLNEEVGQEYSKKSPMLHNYIQHIKTLQLGSALQLDGVDDWIEIKDITDPCILNLECGENGLTVSFWMNFTGGDYIFASGGYAGYPVHPPGFRLQRDPVTKFFKLDVSTKEQTWELYIYQFPKNWFHFAFAWSKQLGLFLYFNAELKLSTNNPRVVEQPTSDAYVPTTIMFGSKTKDNNRALPMLGQFEIVHLAIWKQHIMSQKDIRKIYVSNITVVPFSELCCYNLMLDASVTKTCGRYYFPENWSKVLNSECICPDISFKEIEEKCKYPPVGKVRRLQGGGCYDSLNCKVLVNNQDGFCSDNRDFAENFCAASCRFCVSNVLASVGPKQHFSKETLIFSLVGCIGGLILLLCMMVYFWRVYRTRYHGAFIPPLKKVSLLDVSNDYDDKWSAKYVDSSAFYIKDVPPKKRALPLIPAKTNLSSQRYQPPEFD